MTGKVEKHMKNASQTVSDCSENTIKTCGIEHRLYSIERFVEHPRVKTAGTVEEKLLLCTPACATMYALKGWTVFDYHMSLNMESEYYSEAIEHEL